MLNPSKDLYTQSLNYHRLDDRPGKLSIVPTKPLDNQYDLSLAYSPGVAAPCLKIQEDINQSYNYTNRGNTVAVISNGTAVLGLGNIGAAASAPVMEGKAVLFKKFADIDAIPLLVNTTNIEELVQTVKHLQYSFGGINLEDIKAPECFAIEVQLQQLLDIPVFHDDQHGTAITILAGLINAAHITGKSFANLRVVINGAGAASIASINLLKYAGIKPENIIVCDTKGVVYQGRSIGMNQWKEAHATFHNVRTLSQAAIGADVLIGLSVKEAFSRDMIAAMNVQPIIFALANPEPEITPDQVYSVRSDAIIATGRSDYTNQINNVLCFPYIFRGALDVRARSININMKLAAAEVLAQLARKPVPDVVSTAYSGRKMHFGSEYIIPTPFDPRLLTSVAPAVARAAIDSGVARITSPVTKI